MKRSIAGRFAAISSRRDPTEASRRIRFRLPSTSLGGSRCRSRAGTPRRRRAPAQQAGLPFDVIRHLLAERASVVRGYPGSRGAMWAAALADPRAESALESVVRGRVIDARLPAPALQVEVVGRSGRRYRCDLGLRRPDDRSGMTGLLIEADGLGKYTRPDDLAEESGASMTSRLKAMTFCASSTSKQSTFPRTSWPGFVALWDGRSDGCTSISAWDGACRAEVEVRAPRWPHCGNVERRLWRRWPRNAVGPAPVGEPDLLVLTVRPWRVCRGRAR